MRKNLRRCVYLAAIAYVMLLGCVNVVCAQESPERVPVTWVGNVVFSSAVLEQLVGNSAPAEPAKRKAWIARRLQRLSKFYHDRGYLYQRAWAGYVEGEGVVFEVDEGAVQIVFDGADTLNQFLLRVDISMPFGIYHEPTLRRELQALKKKYRFTVVQPKVVESGDISTTEFGKPIHKRELHIAVKSSKSYGWRFRLSLDSTWGLLPEAEFSKKPLVGQDDHFSARLGVAFPYRRYVFEESPEFRWVHGRLDLEYQMPAFYNKRLAPSASVSNAVSRYTRSDLELQRFYTYRFLGAIDLNILLSQQMTLKVGAVIDYTHAFGIIQQPESMFVLPEDLELLRAGGHLEFNGVFNEKVLRLDKRDEITLQTYLAGVDTAKLFSDSRLMSRLVWQLPRQDIRVRTRGLFLMGDVRFWNEEALAGEFMHCFFRNRYWVREAAQVSKVYQFAVSDVVGVGVFNDFSLFLDRSDRSRGGELGWAEAFGPVLSFMLFDMFAGEVFYAFGFSPSGFGHNFALSIQSAF